MAGRYCVSETSETRGRSRALALLLARAHKTSGRSPLRVKSHVSPAETCAYLILLGPNQLGREDHMSRPCPVEWWESSDSRCQSPGWMAATSPVSLAGLSLAMEVSER